MKETAGEKAHRASLDTTKYNSYELADGLIKDFVDQIVLCAKNHLKKFECLDQFCIVSLIASDCLIKNAMRHKYFALPWLPKPRPDQSCFLFNNKESRFTHLWSLPNPLTMAELSTVSRCNKKYLKMKSWCDSFYNKTFWEDIRKEHDISILSEEELLKNHPSEYENLMKKILPGECNG